MGWGGCVRGNRIWGGFVYMLYLGVGIFESEF